MDTSLLGELAQTLDQARLQRTPVEGLSLRHPELSVPDAYRILELGMALREAAGERRVGLKMGFTSEAKRQQMKLDAPIFGELTDAMRLPPGGVVPLSRGIHPRIEPEIAFITGAPLRGRISREEALAACEGVAPALEIIDSRYQAFKLFSLANVVADNASSSHFVLGRVRSLREVGALDSLSMRFFINDGLRHEALSSAISGHPAESLVQLCVLLETLGRGLPAGSIVLAGGATAAEPLNPGDRIRLDVSGFDALECAAR